MIRLIFFILTVSLTKPCFAESRNGVHLFLGVGNNYVPWVGRIGWDNWEFGRLYLGMVGADKMFFFSKDFYTSFGFGFAGTGINPGFAVTASIGYSQELIWGLGIRGDIGAIVATDNTAIEQAAVGVTYDF